MSNQSEANELNCEVTILKDEHGYILGFSLIQEPGSQESDKDYFGLGLGATDFEACQNLRRLIVMFEDFIEKVVSEHKNFGFGRN